MNAGAEAAREGLAPGGKVTRIARAIGKKGDGERGSGGAGSSWDRLGAVTFVTT